MTRRVSALLLALSFVSLPPAGVRPAAAQTGAPDRAPRPAIRKEIESICQAFVDKDRRSSRRPTGRTGVASRRARTM